ncbi:hypothetical protein IEQ34_010918 [Dendrobium chrysotoxum]|uniref:Uncharacterized protein n=1 Tax=Dendrobium chrysotoxum TaxID=161865 RepID=A0AAV7GVZ6_DENCH|nr:hypothetical protein IEQ34_010918 [Dendrobium chrysotoxum]
MGLAAETAAGGERGSGLADEAGAVAVALAGIGSGKVVEGGPPPWALWAPPRRRRPKPTTRPANARTATKKKKILVALPT